MQYSLHIAQALKAYRRNIDGQFGVIYALIALPMILAIAYVGDLTYAGKVKAELRASLDAAALASVINQKLTESEREDFALTHFKENFNLADNFKLTVKNASAKRVELQADGSFPTHMGAMVGRKDFPLSESSASVVTSEDIVCILALDPSSSGAFSATRGSRLYGNGCSIQVNSTDNQAAIVDNSSTVSAKSICVSGGASGSYTPSVNSECARVEDPYENIAAPAVAATTKCDSTMAVAVTGIEVMQKWIVIGNNVVMVPGVYCKTVSFEGKNITMLPGTYVFQEDLEFFKDSEVVRAEGVTIVLNGSNSVLYMNGGSTINLKAPATGPYAGLAIFQNRQAANIGTKGYSAISEIKNGAGMNITGTVYLPTHRIELGRDSGTDISNTITPTSPATSFIASQIHLTDSTTVVAVDHKSAGLPPILPRSDEGARLVE